MSLQKIFVFLIVMRFSAGVMSTMPTNSKTGKPLTVEELRAKFGQAGTKFGDAKSCSRLCDGKQRTCYYEFGVQVYDSMSGLCGACVNGTIADCAKPGCVPANGVARSIITINQQLPGPPIYACQNDRIIVDVMNHVPGQEVTIHWHGMHQQETPWSDGVPMVTQCPTAAGNIFRYLYYARQVGTHFYHAHTGIMRTNGVFGSLVVREQMNPNAAFYDIDAPENTIFIADWTNYQAEELTPGIRNGAFEPDSLLINGLGSYRNPLTGNYTFAPTATFYCQKGKRYLFRIINAGSHHCSFEFSIPGFKLTVVATDGFSVVPVVVDSIRIGAGERYDFVLNATTSSRINAVRIALRALDVCVPQQLQEFAKIIFVNNLSTYRKSIEDQRPFPVRPSFSALDFTKISLNDPQTDCTKPNGNYCIAALEQRGVSVEGGISGSLRNVEATVITLNFGFVLRPFRPVNYLSIGDQALVGVINNIVNAIPPVSQLTQDDSSVPYCNATNLPTNCNATAPCGCQHLIQLEYCKTYEFVLLSTGISNLGLNHPIHMHGYGFQIVDMGTTDQLTSNRTAFANATHLPVVKDTVMVPFNGFVKYRFNACNPGYWFFHCHYEYHMEIGMQLSIRVGDRSMFRKVPPNFPTCNDYLYSTYDDY